MKSRYDIGYIPSAGSGHDMLLAVVPAGEDVLAAARAELMGAGIPADQWPDLDKLVIRKNLVECDKFDDEDEGIAEVVWRADFRGAGSYGRPVEQAFADAYAAAHAEKFGETFSVG